MKSVNRFIIIGNVDLVASLEKSTMFNIAAYRTRTDKKRARKEVNDWVQVTILDKKHAAWAAENAKASNVALAKGRINNNSYKKDGETVYATDLIVTASTVFPNA